MTETSFPRLLVTGAGGHLGRLVVERLLAAGVPGVIAASRRPEALTGLAERGVERRRADFDDPASLDQAFAGVDRLLIVSTDAVTEPGLRQRQHRAAVAAAARAGVGRIVYTSMINPEAGSPVPFAADHDQTEQAIVASGVAHTILRVGWYQENLLLSLPQALASGTWYSAAGDGRLAHVARDDVAAVAAAALTGAPDGNHRYDVTGGEALTTTEIAALAAATLGRPLQVVPVTDEQLTAGLIAAGVPPLFAGLLVSFDVNTRVGRIDRVSDTVQRLTGRPPRPLAEFLAANRAAFIPAG